MTAGLGALIYPARALWISCSCIWVGRLNPAAAIARLTRSCSAGSSWVKECLVAQIDMELRLERIREGEPRVHGREFSA